MESKVRMLRWIAVIAICAPLVVMIVALVVEWLVLDCNPNPYGQELCADSVDFANAIMIAEYGGLYFAFLLGVFVSTPLFVLSIALHIWGRHGAKKSLSSNMR
jgi:hypothetical protein